MKNLENYLKKHMDEYVLGIRYFDGREMFGRLDGKYMAKTLRESIELYLKENNK